MKRVQEKVKDIIEVRPFSSLHDFTADAAQTLAGYHFTDITADLMAKWLDTVANITPGHGAAAALAGFRGVGKSHFLAVLAAIVSRPDLRGSISDQHVAARADRLSRRHNAVAFVRRGSKETLLEEIKTGLAGIMNCQPHELSDSFDDLLLQASEKTGEQPLVLLIDTALGRDSRVSRDDGAVLSQIAETAKSLGIFVGVALDDDIAGADGANSSIAGNFSIDYLDQEHLYKVVDTHIFAKKEQALPVLQDIYKYFSSVLPGFRWSEQRFISLYPLHPATLEIAPLIRLYLQEFAMLGFASEAGVRILGRPANSLIGLDEIFDAVEKKMRNLPDLAETFAAFDELDRDVVAKTPVHLRLPAKLILKGLFMLSLDGQGSTAQNIAASMLIVNDSETASPSVDVENLLGSFSTANPDLITKLARDGSASKYCFKLAGKDDLNDLVKEAVTNISPDVVPAILLRYASERFSDLANFEGLGPASSKCSVEWRNAIRHGEIFWDLADNADVIGDAPEPRDLVDWKIVVTFGKARENGFDKLSAGYPTTEWRLGKLSGDDIDAIRRLHVLQFDRELREEFGGGLSAANHIQALTVEKIWKRIFLSDAALVFGEKEFRFTDEAQSAHTLAHLLTIMLAPVFESEYPSHPEFPFPLGVKETAKLTGQFFGGSAPMNGDVQQLAESFGLPLGLVELQADGYVPAPVETLSELPIVRSAFDGLEFTDESVITIGELSSRMLAGPYGLAREARHLVLAALVAQRQFEFVTFSGNRINHRSLDLQIIWDDIAGLAPPFTEVYSSKRLREWAVLLTGNSMIRSLDSSEDRLVVVTALSEWLSEWKRAGILEKFETLPDENLSSSIWRIAANLRKTFGAMADCIGALVESTIPLDQCIHNIADLFSDSEAEFDKKKNDLDVLQDFTLGAATRDEIITYLSLCEITADHELEQLRQDLLELTGARYFAATAPNRAEIDQLWYDFKNRFSALYIEKHDAGMNSTAAGEKLVEILGSDRWTVFESFADLSWFDPKYASHATAVIRKVRHLQCKANVAKLLVTQPFCSCSFSLALFERRQDQPGRLEIIINRALSHLRMRMIENGKELAGAIDVISHGKNTGEAVSLKKWLSESKDSDGFANLSAPETRLLRFAVERINTDASSVKTKDRDNFGDLLPNEVRDWENELDRLGIFAETKA